MFEHGMRMSGPVWRARAAVALCLVASSGALAQHWLEDPISRPPELGVESRRPPASSPETRPEQTVAGMVFVQAPAGAFIMGSTANEPGHKQDEGPLREVVFRSPFWIGKFEVTQGQWEGIMGTNPSASRRGASYPVDNVTWKDCREFAARLSARTGRRLRLPSEAEWEYACRAGSTAAYSYGEEPGRLGEHAWYEGNGGGGSHPVGQRPANGWGLHDMHGNVYEWCQDAYADSYSGAPADGTARESSDPNIRRVRRGGSWNQPPEYCRAAFRGNGHADSRRDDVGLRLVLVDDTPPQGQSAPADLDPISGVYEGTWEKTNGTRAPFVLHLSARIDGRMRAAGTVQGWSAWEVFHGLRQDSRVILTGVGVIRNKRPGDQYALDVLDLRLEEGGALRGRWSDVENDSGEIVLKRVRTLDSTDPELRDALN